MSIDSEKKLELVAGLRKLANEVEAHNFEPSLHAKRFIRYLSESNIEKSFEEVVVSMESLVLLAAGKPCSKCGGSGRE
ncbi:hypothetical protein [Stenotrophomonas maltophilia]|uniref:hypothetical protein n=1 Tax=Stenotrophomonas maltophilia TaxID=40324 RepID=UPI00163B56EC|nr:hypothetical protein [Stenotrophomonas maltophilia]EKT4105615.1 hypothetical protein [Stenotrophomonas maltophilia]QNG96499.1 hypothetical protein AEPCKKLL_03288 [Stenotrophomonas maltophilia]HEL4773287.1 hypothetical protein [Stenotrophomonas maltophilia]